MKHIKIHVNVYLYSTTTAADQCALRYIIEKNIRNGEKNIADIANAQCPLCCNLYLGTTKSCIYFFVPDRRALEGLHRTNKLERKEGAVLFKHL